LVRRKEVLNEILKKFASQRHEEEEEEEEPQPQL